MTLLEANLYYFLLLNKTEVLRPYSSLIINWREAVHSDTGKRGFAEKYASISIVVLYVYVIRGNSTPNVGHCIKNNSTSADVIAQLTLC